LGLHRCRAAASREPTAASSVMGDAQRTKLTGNERTARAIARPHIMLPPQDQGDVVTNRRNSICSSSTIDRSCQ
jgi:hypothetical protein